MLNRLELEQVAADKSRFFWANSRSFSFASLGFSRSERELVSSVYAFCRITDDLVDEHDTKDIDVIGRRVDEWLMTARQTFEGKSTTGIGWFDRLMQESAARGVPFETIEILVEGVRVDMDLVQIHTVSDLRAYCYGVASTVGVWMCHLFGVHDPWMVERAEALGRAMQITNIVRDVGEDLARGRVYVPAEMLTEYGLVRSDLAVAAETGRLPSGYEALTKSLMQMAEEDYEIAWEAIPRLPRTFSRAAAVAAEVYRGIHGCVERNGFDNLTTRARTGTLWKILLMLRAMRRLVRRGGMSSLGARTVANERSVDRRSRPPINRSVLGLLFLFSLAASSSQAQVAPDAIDQARARYWGRAESESIDSAQVLLRADAGFGTDPIAKAYDAALEVVKAKHDLWPGKKLEHLSRGLPVLDSLVATNHSLIEPRFLRLLSCYFLPGMLNRQWSVDEDVGVLAILLSDAREQVPLGHYKQMLRFVLQNGQLEDKPRQLLMTALQASYRETVPSDASGARIAADPVEAPRREIRP